MDSGSDESESPNLTDDDSTMTAESRDPADTHASGLEEGLNRYFHMFIYLLSFRLLSDIRLQVGIPAIPFYSIVILIS